MLPTTLELSCIYIIYNAAVQHRSRQFKSSELIHHDRLGAYHSAVHALGVPRLAAASCAARLGRLSRCEPGASHFERPQFTAARARNLAVLGAPARRCFDRRAGG